MLAGQDAVCTGTHQEEEGGRRCEVWGLKKAMNSQMIMSLNQNEDYVCPQHGTHTRHCPPMMFVSTQPCLPVTPLFQELDNACLGKHAQRKI